MKITLLYMGKSKKGYLNGSLQEFYKRIGKYVSINEVVVNDLANSSKISVSERKSQEGRALLDKISDEATLILLDEKGKAYDSRKFASFLEDKMIYGRKNIVFVVGGAYGFSEAMYDRANFKLRLSDMTFSHQIIRLILAEQLYRAFAIINGHPYHND